MVNRLSFLLLKHQVFVLDGLVRFSEHISLLIEFHLGLQPVLLKFVGLLLLSIKACLNGFDLSLQVLEFFLQVAHLLLFLGEIFLKLFGISFDEFLVVFKILDLLFVLPGLPLLVLKHLFKDLSLLLQIGDVVHGLFESVLKLFFVLLHLQLVWILLGPRHHRHVGDLHSI